MSFESLLMIVGFLIAAYSIVANDAIQTLGTFLSSNAHRPWWVLWLFASGIMTAVLVYGWFIGDGDVSYGRLSSIPYPTPPTWVLILPPLAVMLLTRIGAPVSTTFLILTAFAPRALDSMVIKSLSGYVVAFLAAGAIYWVIGRRLERHFHETRDEEPGAYWVALQWLSTGFLWSQWLIQDLANIFAYMPRHLSRAHLVFALVVMLALQAVLFARRGGEIQKIVTSKTNTADIRAAAIINFIYGAVLLVFKEWSNVPMSTTWVFLGLLAGREFAVGYELSIRRTRETFQMAAIDMAKAAFGLAVSVAIAFLLPLLPT